jgi:peptidoglycan/LPS O-acetylase OafA/YrhL
MHPLNGPGWSLFYEYVANILYGLGLRKLSKTALTILVVIAGAVLIQYAVTAKAGDLTGGWSLNEKQLRIGFTRLVYPFFTGLLLSRVVKPGSIKNAFLWCSLLLLVVFCIPRIGDADHAWINGLFEALCIIFVFPLIVYLGASGIIKTAGENRVCKFLGDISYPIYITHYAFIYTYTAWISDNKTAPLELKIGYGALTFFVSILFAYLALKYYDEPVRAWLKKNWKKEA